MGCLPGHEQTPVLVSMKSGLEGRNNLSQLPERPQDPSLCLNEVRPRRPEQSSSKRLSSATRLGVSMKSGLEGRNNLLDSPKDPGIHWVSMKSGLEGRNNPHGRGRGRRGLRRLNEVRPRRPEQSTTMDSTRSTCQICLNEVRPRRPEQSLCLRVPIPTVVEVSMKSGLEGRNN